MVLLCSGMAAALAAFSLFGSTLAVPLVDKLRSLSPGARDLLKRSTPAAPRFVIYSDAWVDPLPSASDIQGYNVFALSFWLSSGAADMAMAWQQLSDGERANYLSQYNAAGISIIVSAFGSTEEPTTWGINPVAIADKLSSWVLQYGLQGVDIDYEDFDAFDNNGGIAEPWLISLTRQLRKRLPQGQYSLSHAPVAPWFSPNMWSGGGYLQVNSAVGDLIDWYNIQFYNQGENEYTTCHGMLNHSSSQWPQTAIYEIEANGVDSSKLVIGKPARPQDASNGYVTVWKLQWCVSLAIANGWNAGVMTWEYPYGTSNWINTVRNGLF